MNIRESAVFALRGVLANKLRSLLTMSGILIGVAAVIILISAGTGANRSITDQITALGANTLTVTPNSTLGGGRNQQGRGGAAANPTSVNTGTGTRKVQLTLDDAEALVDPVLAPDIGLVAPVVSVSSVNATYSGATHAVITFTGTTPSYLTINSNSVQAGVPFTDSDYTGRRRAALLGPTVAKDLVGGDGLGIVGQTVQFNGVSFEVVGVLTAKGSQGPQDRDDVVIAPLTSVQDTLASYSTLSSIAAQATASDKVNNAQDQISAILTARHHVTPAQADFTIFNPSSILATVNTVTGTFTLLLGAVAGISLLRRRDRGHEHHAGDGHRADAGDRHPQGDRRAAIRHRRPVPAGGGAVVPRGRFDRRGDRRARRVREDRHLPAGRGALLDRVGVRRVRGHRAVLRLVPGQSGRVAAADRRPPLRVTGAA